MKLRVLREFQQHPFRLNLFKEEVK